MNKVVNRLNLGIADKDRGMQVYKLAMAANMVQGRTIREVAGACLYVGCRRDPECQVMLIDFSEILEVKFPIAIFSVLLIESRSMSLSSASYIRPL